jgi:hypothetical protein
MNDEQKITAEPPIELLTVSGNGLQPGVDLDNSAALLDLMEESADRDFGRFPGLNWRHPLQS